MSTSLKIQHADEILEAMAEALGEKLVKNADIERGTKDFEAFLNGWPAAKTLQQGANLWNKYSGGFSENELSMASSMWRDKFGDPVPAQAAEDVQMADTETCPVCGKEVVKGEEGEEVEEMAWDPQDVIAAEFAMKQLVKVADALDGKGFKAVADLVDEALEKLASKKKV